MELTLIFQNTTLFKEMESFKKKMRQVDPTFSKYYTQLTQNWIPRIFLFLLLGLCTLVTQAQALKNTHLGRWVITPSFGMEVVYNNNVFLLADRAFPNGNSEGKIEDTIFAYIPTLAIDLPRETGEVFGFHFQYNGRYEDFVDLNDQDTFIHEIDSYLLFGGKGGRSELKIGGSYLDTRQLRNPEIAANLNPRIERFDYRGYLNFIYNLTKRFQFLLDGSIQREDFSFPADTQDDIIYIINPQFLFQWTPQTAFGIQYRYQKIRYDELSPNNAHSNTHTFYGTWKWQATPLILVNLGLGVQSMIFQQVLSQLSQNRTDFVFFFNVTYRPKERTSYRFFVTRDVLDATFNVNQSFLRHVVGFSVTQQILTKWTITGRAQYNRLDYDVAVQDFAGDSNPTPPPPGLQRIREDNFFLFSLNLAYHIQEWLQAQLRYQFRTNDSNFVDREYSNNLVGLSVIATF